VRVYEKIRTGIWSYNGVFHLTDSWQERDEHRTVFKCTECLRRPATRPPDSAHSAPMSESVRRRIHVPCKFSR
jgi:hypothetical protein